MKALNLAGKVLGFGSVLVLWSCTGSSQTQSPPTATAAPATQPVPIVEELHSAGPTSKFVSSQPDVPYLPKPAAQPADWVVEHDPVTPNASPQAKALLHFLYSISGKHTIV